MTARVLPADVYDTLELSAHAFGGIGAGHFGIYDESGCTMVAPLCAHGHCIYAEDAVGVRQMTAALISAGISPAQNDHAVYSINHRRRRPAAKRVSFDSWCRELNVVRGA